MLGTTMRGTGRLGEQVRNYCVEPVTRVYVTPPRIKSYLLGTPDCGVGVGVGLRPRDDNRLTGTVTTTATDAGADMTISIKGSYCTYHPCEPTIIFVLNKAKYIFNASETRAGKDVWAQVGI